MKQNADIPCAQSAPINLEDEVLSALLWRAGELLEWLQSKEQTTAVTSHQLPVPGHWLLALDNVLSVVAQDGDLSRLLEQLPQALGNGVLLQFVFARLFPGEPQPLAVSLPVENGRPKLGRREVEVLQEMAKGRSRKEIAEHLFIASTTVKTHMKNLYAKLEVDNPQKAVAKAAALGLLPFDLADFIQPMRDKRVLNYSTLAYALGRAFPSQPEEWAEPLRRLALLGLLLFLLAPSSAYIRPHPDDHSRRRGILFEFTPDGHRVRSFDGGGSLNDPSAFAFAPPAAERHGFRKGNLFVADVETNPDILNCDSLLELTPDGRCVRAFTGGAHFSAVMCASTSVNFTPDGRMLVAAGDRANAVLEFSKGGKVVRRFAHIVPYGGMTVDKHGNVYVAGGCSRESPIHVFSPQGELLQTVGAAEPWVYQGVAVDDGDNLYVANIHDCIVEVYDAEGYRFDSIGRGDLMRPYRLALSPQGRLYVLDGNPFGFGKYPQFATQAVKVFNPHGALLFSFPAPPGARLTNLTFGPNGNLFVAGIRDEG